MVTFNNAGRMGNWLFEGFSAAAYALKHNLDFTVPSQSDNPKWNPIYCFHLIDKNYNHDLEQVRLWENGHHWQELPFEESWRDKNIIIEGYRQSEQYFKDYRNELLYLFDFPYEKKEGYVAVHIRRGDYLNLTDKHPPVTKEWYENVMSMFSNFRFYFVSDDIDWCRQEFGSRSDCEFSTGLSEVQDLIDGSCCEHTISSSSTFGWWVAWLNRNPNKIVYIPKLWFVENYHLETRDIVPSGWYKL